MSLNGWLRVILSHHRLEELTEPLFEAGAKGVEQISDTQLVCYIDTSDGTAVEEFIAAAQQAGFEHVATEDVEEQNWTARCQELLVPLSVGRFTVRPIVEPQKGVVSKDEDEILIIPGTGFGTGHHAATRLALNLMQKVETNPGEVLDLGTGSGILAIAACRLWPKAEVHAHDSDSLALINAEQNIELNNLKDGIRLLEGSLGELTDPCNLIVANLYAEVLCDLESPLYRALHADGELVLSGIMKEKLEAVKDKFSLSDWEYLDEAEEDGWVGLHLKKKGS